MIRTLRTAALAVVLVAAAPPAPPPPLPLKITGLLFDGLGGGDPEPEECVRIENLGTEVIDLSDVSISDRFGPPRQGEAGAKTHDVAFPPGTQIRPDQEIWIAHQGSAFQALFGRAPDFEAVPTLDGVPRLNAPDGWPNFPADRGVLSLHDKSGVALDLVAYERGGDLKLDMDRVPTFAWRGEAVRLERASPLGWKGQILARDRTAGGGVQPDTDGAQDWDSGFSRTRLGRDPIHRVEYPGQTRFMPWPFTAEEAELTAASAPDNQFAVLAQALDAASEEIRIHVYQFENDHLADRLVAARARGVPVTVYLEGAPVGGIPDQERWITRRLEQAGAKIWYLASDSKENVRSRYKFDHSKYLVIDRALAMIATENFGYTGFPVDPSFGNRGWSVFVREPRLVRALMAVWDADLRPSMPDILAQEADPEDLYGPPFRDQAFTVFRVIRQGKYPSPVQPLTVRGKMGLELVLCPDNCLSEESGVIGLIAGAKESLEVVQNSLPLWWGSKAAGSVAETSNLPLAAVVAAARRGVRTRVLIDGTWYNNEEQDPRDNDDSVRFLNDVARREKLPLSAKVVNLAAADLEKIHAKGVIADGQRTLVGSMNWTESSFKANREVAVVVDHPEVGSYYQTLFNRDWIATRLYAVTVGKGGAKVRARPAAKSEIVRRYGEGDVLDVVGESASGLEVRLHEGQTGYIDRSVVASVQTAAEDARLAIGQAAEVTGRIKTVQKGPYGVMLNFGDDWRLDFSVYLPERVLEALVSRVGSAEALEGREITVRGRIVEKNGPAIKVARPDQVTLK